MNNLARTNDISFGLGCCLTNWNDPNRIAKSSQMFPLNDIPVQLKNKQEKRKFVFANFTDSFLNEPFFFYINYKTVKCSINFEKMTILLYILNLYTLTMYSENKTKRFGSFSKIKINRCSF